MNPLPIHFEPLHLNCSWLLIPDDLVSGYILRIHSALVIWNSGLTQRCQIPWFSKILTEIKMQYVKETLLRNNIWNGGTGSKSVTLEVIKLRKVSGKTFLSLSGLTPLVLRINTCVSISHVRMCCQLALIQVTSESQVTCMLTLQWIVGIRMTPFTY